MDLRAYWLERAPRVEAALEAALPPADEPPAALHAAMRHLVFPGGKRLRPAFAIAAAEAVGAPAEHAVPLAAAVELVHTYSLVHDDLPCMDDDDERRGRPSVHVAFGEATAVLAGDALLAAAFEALLASPAPAGPEALLATARELAHAAGSRELVGGQSDDLAFEAAPGDAERVEHVHARKSAALFAAAVAGGARLGGADAGRVERLRTFGRDVGVAFQIADDRLDRDADEACSLVRSLGDADAAARADALLARALRGVEDCGERAEPLRELARHAVQRSE